MKFLFTHFSTPTKTAFFIIFLSLFSVIFLIDIKYLSGNITLLLPYILLISLCVLFVGNIPGLFFSVLTIVFWLVSKTVVFQKVSFETYIDLLIKSIFIILQFLLIVYIKRLYREIESLSLTDELTGLNNRRGFYTLAQYEILNLARNSNILSVLYLDIDNFKNENDKVGHKEGDKILRVLSDVIKRNTRNMDISARMGGDEFCILLPNADKHVIKAITKRIVNEFHRSCSSNSWLTTLSIGAFTTKKKMDLDLLIKKSDDLMYRAKKNGKNRTAFKEA